MRVVHAEHNFVVIEWDEPANNNSPITKYNIFLSTRKIKPGEINLDQANAAVIALVTP